MPDILDIHILIQQRDFDLRSFINEHTGQIDDHVEVCEECHERVIGFTANLPKLRRRMTVQFPESSSLGERLEQLRQLSCGQCLPCGCEVIDAAWTRELASIKFCKALAEIMEVSEDDAKKIPHVTRLLELLPNMKSLRCLRDKFWIPDGSFASEEHRDAEEGAKVLQLPETIGEFIDDILNLHSGISYIECYEHWCP